MKKAFILVLVSVLTMFLLPINHSSAAESKEGSQQKFSQAHRQRDSLTQDGTKDGTQRALDSANGRPGKAKDRKYWDSVDEAQMSVQNSLAENQQKKIDYSHTKQRIALVVFLILSVIAVFRIVALGKKQKALIKLRQEGGIIEGGNTFKHEDLSQTRLEKISDLKKAIKKDTKNPALYIERADYYVKVGLITSALEDYSTAIKLDPTNALAYWQRHLANKILGRNISADKDRVKALSLDPSLDVAALN